MKQLSIKISVFLLLLLSNSLYAQNLTNSEARKINTMLLDLVERYEDFAGVYDGDTEYEFIRLFKDSESPVYAGDLLLGYDIRKSAIPARQYATELLDYAENISVKISKVRKGVPYFDNGEWYVPIRLKKSVEYTDGNIIISSREYYQEDFELTILAACDLENERCKISSITGNISSNDGFPRKFWVIQEPEKHSYSKISLDELLTADGEKIRYNSYGYAIVPEEGLDELNEMKYEVRITADTLSSTLRHKVIAYDFKKTRGRIKLRNKFAPFSAYSLDKKHTDLKSKSWAYELGCDFGFGLPMGPTGATRFGAFVGVAASISSIGLTKESIQYDYTLQKTDDNPVNSNASEEYKYSYVINSVSEKASYVDLTVPVYLSFDHRLDQNGRFWLNWNVGAKAYLSIDPISGGRSLDIDGQLSKSQNKNTSTIDLADTKVFVSKPMYSKNFIDLSATANAALHIMVSRSAFITVGAGYELGLTDSHVGKKGSYFSQSSYPIVYSDSQNTTKAAHSLFDYTTFKRKAIWLDLGFMLKF